MKKFFENKKLLIGIIILVVALMAFINSVFVYFNYGHFEKVGDMHVGRWRHHSFLMSDGRVMIVGGEGINTSIEIFDPKTNTFTFKKDLGVNIFGTDLVPYSSIVLLKNDKLLITGGELIKSKKGGPDDETILKTAKLYDPVKNELVNLPDMNTAKFAHTSVLLKDGNVLLFGGFGEDKAGSKGDHHNKAVELYVPKLNKFIQLKTSKSFSIDIGTETAVLDNGNVFITWGTSDYKQLVTIFDPKTNEFKDQDIEILVKPRSGSIDLIRFGFDPKQCELEKIVLLKNNKLVLFENYTGDNNIAILDLNTNKIQNIGHMKSKGRHGFEATSLNDNNILITNGLIGFGPFARPANTNEIFDSKRLKFYTLNWIEDYRPWASAVLLKDGRVLISGGGYNREYLKSAIVYIP